MHETAHPEDRRIDQQRSDHPTPLDLYAGEDPVWSGEPNQALVDLAQRLPIGRALDVGSGEGADAVWLARRGWQVTGVEPSETAQRRAHAAAEVAGVTVDWVESTLLEASLPAGGFDLVSCFYPALFRSPDHKAETELVRLVAAQGALLFVTHADVDREHALERGFDPEHYVDHAAVRDLLDETWDLVLDERRPRKISGGGGAHHHTDLVLLARRR